MALIKCPECGREVSDKAAACPQCGYPLTQPPASPSSRGKAGAVIFRVVTVLLLAAIAFSSAFPLVQRFSSPISDFAFNMATDAVYFTDAYLDDEDRDDDSLEYLHDTIKTFNDRLNTFIAGDGAKDRRTYQNDKQISSALFSLYSCTYESDFDISRVIHARNYLAGVIGAPERT